VGGECEFVVDHNPKVFNHCSGWDDVTFVCECWIGRGGKAAWEEEDFSFVDVEFDSNGRE